MHRATLKTVACESGRSGRVQRKGSKASGGGRRETRGKHEFATAYDLSSHNFALLPRQFHFSLGRSVLQGHQAMSVVGFCFCFFRLLFLSIVGENCAFN